MNKLLLTTSALILCLCSCVNSNETNTMQSSEAAATSVTTSNNQNCSCCCGNEITSISLTLDNVQKYFTYSLIGNPQVFHNDFTISFQGVLSFALYDEVAITLNLNAYKEESSPNPEVNENFERTISLNAAGYGSSTLYYSDSTIDHVVQTNISDIRNYTWTWSIKSISGFVKYRL